MKFLHNLLFGMGTKTGVVLYFVTFLGVDAWLFFH
jgi:hypothetical protein